MFLRTLRGPLLATGVAGMMLITSLPSQAHAASPHLSPAGWAAWAALNDVGFWASTPNDANPWSVDMCEALPPTSGDTQAIAVSRTCVAAVRWVAATNKISPTGQSRRLRSAAASSFRQGRILAAESAGLANQLTGDCRRFFVLQTRVYRRMNVATARYSRALRAGRPQGAAWDRWGESFVKAALPLVSEKVVTWGNACQPPADLP